MMQQFINAANDAPRVTDHISMCHLFNIVAAKSLLIDAIRGTGNPCLVK